MTWLRTWHDFEHDMIKNTTWLRTWPDWKHDVIVNMTQGDWKHDTEWLKIWHDLIESITLKGHGWKIV